MLPTGVSCMYFAYEKASTITMGYPVTIYHSSQSNRAIGTREVCSDSL